jgi:hypothetical protein
MRSIADGLENIIGFHFATSNFLGKNFFTACGYAGRWRIV